MPAKSIFSGFRDFLNENRDLAVPLVSSLAYGREGASAAALERERAYYGSINGSGPVDPMGAIRDADRRENTPGLSFSGGQVAGIPTPWILGGVILVLVLIVALRRR